MTQERTQALALPTEADFKRDIMAINRFQKIVHQTMVKGLDYGIIPGTGNKPTLLKPGAEKIGKLLGLADQYEIVDRQENWETGFFRYLVRCKLVHITSGAVVSEGLGECNSMESKYRWRWVGERDLPDGADKSKLVSQERRSKTGGHWKVYRLENEDIYSQVNTILKMGKKRALVDAALSAGRLSDIFTQDIEDIGEYVEPAYKEPTPPTSTPANGKVEEPEQSQEASKLKQEGQTETGVQVDADWLKETLGIIHWSTLDAVKWMNNQFGLTNDGKSRSLTQRVAELIPEERLKFVTHIQELKEAAGQ